jgi:F0F1-type ATP synthase gamma subunit
MDRIEKFIANILNDNESYSNLKQVAKENVKAVLSDNKMLISTAFAAMIQTLKADPQMVNLIQNIPHANDGEQHKDNNINITNYLESNKDMILALTEKNYENLIEALTNDSISSAAVYSSNSMLSLPQSSSSSSTFPMLFFCIYFYKT